MLVFMDDLPPILVAEDSDDDYHFLRQAFRAAAMENPLLRFRDGTELTHFLDQLPPREGGSPNEPWLVLVDLAMPLMNGFEVLEWLRGRKSGPKLKVVILSGSQRPEDVERAMALGAVEYVVKPISSGTLALLAGMPTATSHR